MPNAEQTMDTEDGNGTTSLCVDDGCETEVDESGTLCHEGYGKELSDLICEGRNTLGTINGQIETARTVQVRSQLPLSARTVRSRLAPRERWGASHV